jgi:hypothetical protein
MADESLQDRPEVTFDFNLPHGVAVEESNGQQDTQQRMQLYINSDGDNDMSDLFGDDEFSTARGNDLCAGDQDSNDREMNFRQFSSGFSDDEGSREAFDCSWESHEAKKRAAKAAKSTKSPRRSDNEDEATESEARAKKLRQSLFVESDAEMEEEEQVGNLFAPATPGRGIGNRMSSLNLDQQENSEEATEASMTTGLELACSDIGSVHNSPVPSDDEVVIRPEVSRPVRSLMDCRV